MSNPLFDMLGNSAPQNPAAQMIQQFREFQKSFRGDPRQQVQQLINSGRVSQQQYDSAVRMANDLRRMFGL